MRKIIFLIICLYLFSGKVFSQNDIAYCPDKIECTKKDDINSCKAIWDGKFRQWWKNIWSPFKVENGIYYFEKAQAPYDSSQEKSFSSICSYGFKINSKIIKFIYLYSDDKEKMEALSTQDADNKWNVKSSEHDGVVANCYSNQISSCPLIKKE